MAASSAAVSAIKVPASPPREAVPPQAQRPAGVKREGAPGAFAKIGALPWSEIGVPVSVLAVVLAMIVPLPPWMLDGLIAVNIMLSVIVLLVGIYVSKPVDFSVFPTALLLMTLFRLALNISTSRLILLNGNSGTQAAGHVIEAFGTFVVGGNYIIGTVIFLVLIAIQYVVINHGAVRISEVTARFALDALPGKQMSIDSDLNAGLIDETEAKTRRKNLALEAEFYGAMDGASRFTQRDAVASVLITAINIIAGFLIGVFQHGMDLKRALATYTVLTIGDGLVTVIPALMISVSGGLIVTRASSGQRLGEAFGQQVFSNPQPLFVASGVLATMAFFPGLPAATFLMLAAGTGAVAWRLQSKVSAAAETTVTAPAPAKDKDNLESLLKVELLAVEVGLGLVRMVEGGANSPLLRRIGGIRKQLAADLGFILPPVRVTDNLSLKPGEYAISIKGNELARFEIPQGCEMAIASGAGAAPPEGRPAREPAFGLQAWWIPSAAADRAREMGYTVVDSISILGTHLSETVRRYAHELFTRKDAKKLLDRVSEDNQRLVEDLVPKLIPAGTFQKVIQNLLRERVSIRDAASVLEAMSEAAQITKNPALISEYVRQSMKRTVVQPYLNGAGEIQAYLLDPQIEQAVESAAEHGEHASHLNLPPLKVREVIDRVQRGLSQPEGPATLLTTSGARYFLRQILEAPLPHLAVLSHGEIPPGVKVAALGTIR